MRTTWCSVLISNVPVHCSLLSSHSHIQKPGVGLHQLRAPERGQTTLDFGSGGSAAAAAAGAGEAAQE